VLWLQCCDGKAISTSSHHMPQMSKFFRFAAHTLGLLALMLWIGSTATAQTPFSITYNFPVSGSSSTCTGGYTATNEPSGSSAILPALCVSTGLVQRVNGLGCVAAPTYAGFNSSCWQNSTKPATQATINNSPAVSWLLTACYGEMEITRINLRLRRSNTGPQQAALFYRIDAGNWIQWDADMSGYTTTNSSDTPFSLNGSALVPEGSQIEFRLLAWNGSGVNTCSSSGGTLRLRTALEVVGEMTNNILTAPTLNAETGLGCAAFTANWQTVTGASLYMLDVSTAADFSTFLPGYQDRDMGTATTHTITGLSLGTTYYYRVRARRACDVYGVGPQLCTTSPYSVVGTVTTNDLPATPNVQPATLINCTDFTANWQAVPGATDYTLEVADNAAFTGASSVATGAVTSRVVTGLSLSTTYHYRVRATNACGQSVAFSSVETATTPTIAAAPTLQPLTGLSCTGFTASWSPVLNATGYSVEVADNAGFASATVVPIGAATTSHLFTGLSSNTTYFCRVRATDPCGQTAYSNVETATTPVLVAPTPVLGTVTCNSIALSWNAISGAVNGYEIEYTPGASGTPLTTTALGTSATLSALLSNTSYSIRIRTRVANGCANSAYSAPTNATTPVDPNLALTVTAADVCVGDDVTITVAGSEAGVQYSLQTAGGTTVQGPVSGNGGNLNFTLTGLDVANYTYRVFATNGAATLPCEGFLATDATFQVNAYPTLVREQIQTVPGNTEAPIDVRTFPFVTFITPFDGNLYTFEYNDGSAQEVLPGGVPALHPFAHNGYYTVRITADNGSCQTSLTLPVDTRYRDAVKFPNVFTPNNDGINDVYEVNEGPTQLTFQVFNRWGALVYSTQSLPIRWNGRMDNSGIDCPEGTYLFSYKATAIGGQVQERAGSITLIR
jgi:gliding motility-associated-like protein